MHGSKAAILMVGNKADLTEKRKVSYEEGQDKARELGSLFCEASAKEGKNISQMLIQLASHLPGIEGANFTLRRNEAE